MNAEIHIETHPHVEIGKHKSRFQASCLRSERPVHQREVKGLEYMYAAMLLADVNISEALKAPTLTAAASASALAPAVEEEKAEEKAEKEEEKKEEEEDLQGLSALFG